MIVIKSSEKLFNRYKRLQTELMYFAGIVQNDSEIEKEKANNWYKDFLKFTEKVKKLREDTVRYLKECKSGWLCPDNCKENEEIGCPDDLLGSEPCLHSIILYSKDDIKNDLEILRSEIYD